ncbi:hypothetical protein [Calothrix rhizosoleniae]|uniref:hypothetical protein n=1 Tax=Calothrix rhizosoleniae TaxID=888997 RepID=UPI000B49DC8C|nr:hypothetical protein [Calothrix rhizosoleniae]
MIDKTNLSNTFYPPEQSVGFDLLEALLSPEDETYPWNPLDPESEEYLLKAESQFVLQDVIEEEFDSFSPNFYAGLDDLWAKFPTTEHYNHTTGDSIIAELQKTLQLNFAAQVPQDWLQKIAQAAGKMLDSQASIGEQLVQCVQSVLPTWQEDDLFVLARPLAYAMRSSDNNDANEATQVLEKIGDREWTTLSEIEQARLSIAIAHHALKNIQQSQETEK